MSTAFTSQRPSIRSKSLSRSSRSTPGCSTAFQPRSASFALLFGLCWTRACRRRSLATPWSVRPSRTAFSLIRFSRSSSIASVVRVTHQSVLAAHQDVNDGTTGVRLPSAAEAPVFARHDPPLLRKGPAERSASQLRRSICLARHVRVIKLDDERPVTRDRGSGPLSAVNCRPGQHQENSQRSHLSRR